MAPNRYQKRGPVTPPDFPKAPLKTNKQRRVKDRQALRKEWR